MTLRQTSPPTSMADQTECRLLSLPAELRNRIYEIVFCGVSHQIPGRDTVSRSPQECHSAPGILLTCKQIHKETLSMFYTHAAFCFSHSWELCHWLKQIGLIRQQQINFVRFDVAIYWSGEQSEDALRTMEGWALFWRAGVLERLHRSDALLGDEKVYVRMHVPGTSVYWTNQPEKVRGLFVEKLREIKDDSPNVSGSDAWNKMIKSFLDDRI